MAFSLSGRERNLRRTTRLSSPTTSGERRQESAPKQEARARERPRTILDLWIEPPLRTPAPSFEDNRGLERVGVLEHMAPLGQPPTQKLLHRLKLAPSRIQHHRASPVLNEGETTPTSGIETTEPASPTDLATRFESAKPGDRNLRGGEIITTPSPTRMTPQNDLASKHHHAIDISSMPAPPSVTTPSSTASPIRHPEHFPPERIRVHINGAIQEARSRNSHHLIPGLSKVQEDALADPSLWGLLDAVLHKSPTRQQMRTFRRYIKAGVAQYTSSTTPNSTQPSHPSPSLNHINTPLNRPLHPTTAISPTNNAPTHVSAPYSFAATNTVVVAPSLGVAIPPQVPSPTHYKMHRPSCSLILSSRPPNMADSGAPSAPAPANADLVAATNGTTRQLDEETLKAPLTQRERSRSVSSSSSLSSAKSLDAETFAPTIELESGAHIDGKKAGKPELRQASARVAASNRNRPAGHKTRFPNLNPSHSKATGKKRNAPREDSDIDQEEISRQKRRFTEQSFHDVSQSAQESNERTVILDDRNWDLVPSRASTPTVPTPVVHPHYIHPLQAALSSPVEAEPPAEYTLRNSTSRKRSRNEIEFEEEGTHSPASSSPGPLLVPPPPGAASLSRSGTPRVTRLPPSKKTKKSARVMVSPNKAKNGRITAGISRAGPGRSSAVGNGVDSSEEENNDYCGACGGNGELLCCDGCPNSFHFSCLDPPIDLKSPPDGEWYCPQCIARRNRAPAHTIGILGRLIKCIDDINPKAYALPREIREYFEGVKTGDDGEYEDIFLTKTQNHAVKMNRAGFIEGPNYKDPRDSKGNLILCYVCKLTPHGRDIIPCDFCPARWHLDCLDPPLAVPPRRTIGEKPTAGWRCPLHYEHDLARMDRSDGTSTSGGLGTIPKIRKPKNAIPFDVGLSRGFRNNGLIEVELMKDEEPNFKEVDMMGTIYRIPEKGIQLDFIDRVKRSWYEDQTFPLHLNGRMRLRVEKYIPASVIAKPSTGTRRNNTSPPQPSTTAAANAALQAKSFREQQAVLSLRDFGGSVNTDGSRLLDPSVSELTNRLIADAPTAVVSAMQRSELDALLQMQELVRKRIAVVAPQIGEGINGTNG